MIAHPSHPPFMRRIQSLFAVSAALIVLAGCRPSAPADGPPADPPAPQPVPSPPAAESAAGAPSERTTAARQAWGAREIRTYIFAMEITCVCVHRGRYDVVVQDGKLFTVRDPGTGQLSPESRVEWILTVDQLFERMGQAEQLGTAVRAVYDVNLGYPSLVEIGTMADDTGTRYRIWELREIEPAPAAAQRS
jgi:hypothetical protein